MGASPEQLSLSFAPTPAAVAVAQYALLSLAREHAPSHAAIEDLRLALDEVLFALPEGSAAQLELHVRAGAGGLEATVRVTGARVRLDDAAAALVDRVEVDVDDGVQVVRLVRTWP